jgi:hypothetical protein
LKERKFAEQLLGALNMTARPDKGGGGKKKGGEFEISGPSDFRLVQHTGPAPGGAAASAQAASDLPPGWSTAIDQHGRKYYYNTLGESRWDPPPMSAPPPSARSSAGPFDGNGSVGKKGNDDPVAMGLAQRLLDTLPPTLARVDASQVHVAAVIGKGCYGTVYEGNWSGRAVAVKQLDVSSRQAGGGTVEKSLKEFEVEARLMHRISEHPNVLAILGILVDLPQLSIVMEFMELTDLYAVLTSGEQISVVDGGPVGQGHWQRAAAHCAQRHHSPRHCGAQHSAEPRLSSKDRRLWPGDCAGGQPRNGGDGA